MVGSHRRRGTARCVFRRTRQRYSGIRNSRESLKTGDSGFGPRNWSPHRGFGDEQSSGARVIARPCRASGMPGPGLYREMPQGVSLGKLQGRKTRRRDGAGSHDCGRASGCRSERQWRPIDYLHTPESASQGALFWFPLHRACDCDAFQLEARGIGTRSLVRAQNTNRCRWVRVREEES